MKSFLAPLSIIISCVILIRCNPNSPSPTPSSVTSPNVGVISTAGLSENLTVTLSTTSGYEISGYGSNGSFNSVNVLFSSEQPKLSSTVTLSGTNTNPSIYLQNSNGVDYQATSGTASIVTATSTSTSPSITVSFSNVIFTSPSNGNTITGSGQLVYVE